MTETQVVKASELDEKVVQRIFETRNPEAMREYRKDLAKFKRRTKGKTKQIATRSNILGSEKVEGYFVKVFDQVIQIQEPKKPQPIAWQYRSYEPGLWHAHQVGLLNDPAYNREIRLQRVLEYAASMRAGEWRDLLSDPIAITEDGQVVNGQHRLAAASRVDWSKVENDPSFLVVWGVDATEALHADGSRRTANDEKTIATKLVART